MFIPSLQKNINFKSLTIEQYKNIALFNSLYPSLNIGFNIAFINTIIENCTEKIQLTNFDKNIIGLQIHLNDIKEKNIIFKNLNITHPTSKIFKSGLYSFELSIPTLDIELECNNLIIQNNITNVNDLLYYEIAKYITCIKLNNVDINYNGSILNKINILKKIPSKTLVYCMLYIDEAKTNTELYYTVISNIPSLKFNMLLLVS
jgi:hypothetical protein